MEGNFGMFFWDYFINESAKVWSDKSNAFLAASELVECNFSFLGHHKSERLVILSYLVQL